MSVITIIVPIYNVEKYLYDCINSILAQRFVNFECILIDDGSTDKCPEMCDEFAKRDKRFIVIHKKNGGVSSARNAGLNIATSKYICFVDSDDIIGKDYLSNLMQGEFDFVISGLSIISKTPSCDKTMYNVPGPFESKEVTNIGSCIINLEKLGLLNGPYQKRYRLSIIRDKNIKFDVDLSFGEDTIFVLVYLQYVFSIKVVNKSDYFYLRNDNSLTRKRHQFLTMMKYVKQMRELRMNLYNRCNVSDVFVKHYFEINYQQFLFLPIYSLYYTQTDKNERIYMLDKLYKDKEIVHRIIIRGNFLKNIGSSILLMLNNIYFSDLFYGFVFSVLRKIKPSLFEQKIYSSNNS
jgi:glycosyltransferase involved in cell wall biosynthesis